MTTLIEHITNQLLDIQSGKLWVGANYESRLNSIHEENAFIRPLPELHSVAEIISHLTVWQTETILKIKTGRGELTDTSIENWYSNKQLQTRGWSIIYDEYKNSLSQLIKLLSTKQDNFLEEKYYDPDFKGFFPYSFVINGMLHHSIYHLGQIGLIIKFIKRANRIST